jgi:hypothetical protein
VRAETADGVIDVPTLPLWFDEKSSRKFRLSGIRKAQERGGDRVLRWSPHPPNLYSRWIACG